ncbi:amine acid ABC transporter, permease protein, 3-TM region, His/Glu/Gln/Arg/opine family [Rhizobium leguminosarum bv. trifolii WSM597]|uniref:Amine acid ABC transporter, permease protein, 3-TM region, His/Glu/Gln/Arg/opine family n=1 Tax=Rhizobium leguminosarum bv. trifolii WSM597 TaxID=754764 RepID=J0H9K5_RHILT|nr:amino acid ABC transporter permease [Rhizobium leguminosarum]EJB07038.1 amine acid ABC transporter, permease protein, 3-TM region, His/Glu/Gln/Arg/opine family [Rhizobium leguminosarum bv. trifolii WSM597]
MTEFTLWDIIRNLLIATKWTLVLSLVAFVGGAGIGFCLLLIRVGKYRAGRMLVAMYVSMFQGTPLLMQMFLAYFGLGLLGFDVPAWLAAGGALVLWSSAFLTEIWRGCVKAIARGQWEASCSLGMTFLQQMRYVIVPQAVRLALPPTTGFVVQVVKATALTSIVGFIELSRAAVSIANATYQPATVYGFVALIYFVINWPMSKASQHLEGRLHVTRKH